MLGKQAFGMQHFLAHGEIIDIVRIPLLIQA